jgi:predicted RNA binding protein YcfA (HicA-like mRNA interferase family)
VPVSGSQIAVCTATLATAAPSECASSPHRNLLRWSPLTYGGDPRAAERPVLSRSGSRPPIPVVTDRPHEPRKLRAMKVREVIRMIQADGWTLERTVGSHRQFRHPSKPGTVTIAGNLGRN